MLASVYSRLAEATQAMVVNGFANPKTRFAGLGPAILLYARPYFGFADRLM
jgi:hypothetical protein